MGVKQPASAQSESLVINIEECCKENVDVISKTVEDHFSSDVNKGEPYWISLNMSGLCSSEFNSSLNSQENGFKKEFIFKLLEKLVP